MDLLDERDRDLVLSCVSYLTSIRSRFLSARLSELVTNSTDNEFKELMLELLKCELEVGAVRELSSSGNPRCRMAAAILVGKIGNRPSMNVLKPMAKDRNPLVRAETARSLSRVGTPQAVKVLESMTWDTDAEVGKAVEESLDSLPEKKPLSSIWDRPVHVPAASEFQKGGLNETWGGDRIIG
jgi:HEAT repeat protein